MITVRVFKKIEDAQYYAADRVTITGIKVTICQEVSSTGVSIGWAVIVESAG